LLLLKVHYESRETAIYNLVVSKDGLKIKLSEDQTPVSKINEVPPPLCGTTPLQALDGPRRTLDPRAPLLRGSMRISGGPAGTTLTAAAVPLSVLANVIRQSVDRPVFDKTGLTGLFDLRLQYGEGMAGVPTPFGGIASSPTAATAPSAADPLPSLFTALQEQLGLKLESSKAAIEVLEIESAKKPLEN
jgi:uncharacterized protein (TIGR03435 family)